MRQHEMLLAEEEKSVPHNSLNMNELIKWEAMPIPLRSKLYHMMPIGIGTGLVESATGYSARLAVAHSVTLAVLFGYEIAPLLNKNHLRNSEARSNKKAVLANSFRTLAPAVDGHGITAESYIGALKKLTMRDDLRYLTMLPWKRIISHRQLIRPKRAWCPGCYEEWHRNDGTIYEPLIWSLVAITACVRHQRRLRSRCHQCSSELRLLASRSRPGYCNICQAWLGELNSAASDAEKLVDSEELRRQQWVETQISELLKSVPATISSPQSSILANSISRSIRNSPFKNELAFARRSGLSQSTVNDLCHGKSVPQLSTLLTISFFTKVSVLDLVIGAFPERVEDSILNESDSIHSQSTRHSLTPHRWPNRKVREVRCVFEALLKIHPPLAMAQIKSRLNCHASTLSSKFPDLCQQALSKYREHVENLRRDFWTQVSERIEVEVESAAPLSVSEIAREFGCSRTAVVKRYPALCIRLSKNLLKRREEHWSIVKASLQDSLCNNPPLHLKAIAEQLKLSHTSLYKRFPHLCHEIANRYALYMRQVRVLKRESLRREVKSIAIALYKQGTYPSVRKVSQHLSKPMYLRSSKVALASLREVRQECALGLKL